MHSYLLSLWERELEARSSYAQIDRRARDTRDRPDGGQELPHLCPPILGNPMGMHQSP